MPDRYHSPQEFASAIRAEYPGKFEDVDDGALTHAVLQEYPDFRQHVIDPLEGSEQAHGQTSAPPPRYTPPPVKAPEGFTEGMQRLSQDPTVPAPLRPVAKGLAFVTGGARQALEGTELATAQDATARQRAAGATEAIGGTLNVAATAIPVIVLGAASPVAAAAEIAAGVAAGTFTQEGAEHVLQKMGISDKYPEYTHLFTTVLGLFAGGKAAHGVERFGTGFTKGGQEFAASQGPNSQYMARGEIARRQAAGEYTARTDRQTAQAVSIDAAETARRVHEGQGTGPFEYLTTIQRLRSQEPGAPPRVDLQPPDPMAGATDLTAPPRLALPPASYTGQGDLPGRTTRPLPQSVENVGPPPLVPEDLPTHAGPWDGPDPQGPLFDAIGDMTEHMMTAQAPLGPPRLVQHPENFELARPTVEGAPPTLEQGELPGPRRPKFTSSTEALTPGGEAPTVDQRGLPLPAPKDKPYGLLPEERAAMEQIVKELNYQPEHTETSPKAMLQTIAKYGGIDASKEMYKGELERIWEAGGRVGDVRGVLTRTGTRGRSIDLMATDLAREDPRFKDLSNPNALLAAIEDWRAQLNKKSVADDHPPVFWDIAGKGPDTVPQRRVVQASIEHFLETGRGKWGSRALDIARERVRKNAELESWRQSQENTGEEMRRNIPEPQQMRFGEEPPHPAWLDEDQGAGDTGLIGLDMDAEGPPSVHPGVGRDADLDDNLARPVPDFNPGAGLLPDTPTPDSSIPVPLHAHLLEQGWTAEQLAKLTPQEAHDAFVSRVAPPQEPLGPEAGALLLNIRPSKASVRRFLNSTADEHGDEDWHIDATAALDRGDEETAYKIASLAGRTAGAGRFTEDPAKVKAQVEQDLGEKLPHGTTIGEGGVVVLPKNPPMLNPTYSDLTLGRNFMRMLLGTVNPENIVRITDEEGKVPSDLPKELRVMYQSADQLLRSVPDDILEPILDELGISREQAAAHFARSGSQAGKVLNLFSQFVHDNDDAFIHLDPMLFSTKGPGAAGRLEFLPAEMQDAVANYLDILRRRGATPELTTELGKFGYKPPAGLSPKAAQADMRGWLRTQQKQIEYSKVIDAVAKKYDGSELTIAAAMGDVPKAGQALEDLSQYTLATMLGQSATAMKILLSHGLRFGIGIGEEAMAGVSARMRGDYAASAQHFAYAQRAASVPFTQLDYLPKGLLHSPWSDNLEAVFHYGSTLDPESAHMFFQALEKFPQESRRLQGAALAGAEEGQLTRFHKIRNVITVGIRASMLATRAIDADATVRALIRAKGDDPIEVFGKFGGLINKYGADEARNMIGAATSSALNKTYAGNPLPESPVGKILSTMRELPGAAPLIRTVKPFVRFSMATVPRFIWDRMPGTWLFDIPMHLLEKRGRLSLGLQLEALQKDGGILDATQARIASSQFKAADTQTEALASIIEARSAKKELGRLQAGASANKTLPGMEGQMQAAADRYAEKMEAAHKSRSAHLAARQEVADMQTLYNQRLQRANQLREIDAPSRDQYIARQAAGLLLMATAFGIRGMKQNQGTKYYEHRTSMDGDAVDLRGVLAGYAPYLHTADFFQDVIENTAWKKVRSGEQSMREAYTGKYNTPATLRDVMADWFEIAPVTGVSSILADLLTGQAPEQLGGNSSFSLGDDFLQAIGEQAGRLLIPLETVKDVAGSVRHEEALTRSAGAPGKATPLWQELAGPAMSHIPGVAETLPEKVSPLTGKPMEKEHPLLHQLTGLSFKSIAPLEEEMNKIGLEYGKAVPKQTGDREFDNQINTAYGALLKEHLPTLLDNQTYQSLSKELKVRRLTEVLAELKQGAMGKVASELDAATVFAKTESGGAKRKRALWQGWLEQMVGENAKDLPPDDQPQDAAPEPGAPPQVTVQ